MHPTDVPAQSGACLARACECDASNETKQRACSMSKRNTVPPALPYSTLDTWTMCTLEANRPSPKQALIARERSERNHARLSCLEKDMRRIQTQEAASDATTENETNNPSTPKEISRRSRLTATIVGVPQCDRRAGANAMNL